MQLFPPIWKKDQPRAYQPLSPSIYKIGHLIKYNKARACEQKSISSENTIFWELRKNIRKKRKPSVIHFVSLARPL